ncbi:MAG: translation initiation factor IF-3 [Candidatus Amesbacteria bacterium]|nr:translation initiation factor IF-3 [Candidatus Amesbacteria bacterium]
MSTVHYRINNQIQAVELRVLREDGTQLGVLSKEDALAEAKKLKTDLVEVAPQAMPPVAKLIEYSKFKYQLARKEREAKSSQKKVELKDIRMTPFMAIGDFETKMTKARNYLTDGDKVRFVIKFVGRQLTHKEFGDTVWQRAVLALADISKIEQAPKWVGKQYIGAVCRK